MLPTELDQTHKDLLDRLSKDPAWALLYVDPLAVVFARAEDAGLAGDSAQDRKSVV